MDTRATCASELTPSSATLRAQVWLTCTHAHSHTHTETRGCSPWAGGCRSDLPLNCSSWQPGVTIEPTREPTYHTQLRQHTFCLAFPGDGWSSRVVDAIIHGCIPVIVEDESHMFWESALAEVGLGVDYADFSLRLPEVRLPQLIMTLRAVSAARVRSMRALCMKLRDYFIYKDMYNPEAAHRMQLLATGRRGQDGFLLLALALEARARSLGKLPADDASWLPRNRRLLGVEVAV